MRIFIIIGVLAVFSGCNIQLSENKEYQAPLRSGQVDSLIQKVTSGNAGIKSYLLTKSTKGKNVWVVTNTEKSNQSNLRILIFAQQHGNEPSGKEALLSLIAEIAEKQWDDKLSGIELYLVPCMNPDGADLDQRRNGAGIDQNRDHLLQQSVEVYALHRFFDSIQPHITVDIHEYYPYDSACYRFGFLKQFDIQFGCLTNTNINASVLSYSKKKVLPFIEQQVKKSGFSFFEYTVGSLAYNDKLRHSTVDINDGRQSFGIRPGLSFIIEGIAGKTCGDNLPKRTKGQYATVKALLDFARENRTEIIELVNHARKNPVAYPKSIALRLDHFKTDSMLHYPLYNIAAGKDSIFIVSDFLPLIRSDVMTEAPKGYLIPKNDTMLLKFVQHYGFVCQNCTVKTAYAFAIDSVSTTIVEENSTPMPWLRRKKTQINPGSYVYLDVNQPKGLALILALEPQSSVGLVVYSQFDYLIRQSVYPVLRVE